jgi:6-phosphofructokinase 1
MFRGCETWIVREGYEGLVRGNSEWHAQKNQESQAQEVKDSDPRLVHSLRFGDGELLRDGTGDLRGDRTLKGRYIVRVGWDDVRGWFAEVGGASVGNEVKSETLPLGRYTDRNSTIGGVPYT